MSKYRNETPNGLTFDSKIALCAVPLKRAGHKYLEDWRFGVLILLPFADAIILFVSRVPPTRTMKPLLSVIFLALWGPALAEKDSNYYPEGMVNSNVDEKMYWRDASNVLEDLGEFDALYVTFHSCV